MNIGYAVLRNAVAEVSASTAVQRNLTSALAQWLDCFSLAWDSMPETHLWKDFDASLEKFRDFLAAKGLPRQTQNDRSTLMRAWRRFYAERRIEIVAPSDFAGALHYAMQERGISVYGLAKSIDINCRAIRDWISGIAVPSRRNEHKLKAAESVLHLPENHLVRRIPSWYGDLPDDTNANLTVQRIKARKQRGKGMVLNNIPEQLRQEWMELLDYKTRILPRGVRRSTSWRLKPASRIPTKIGPMATLGSMVCPTAELNWYRLRTVLGFFTGPRKHGGLEMDSSVLSLATLADSNCICDFIEYLRSLSGKYHGGVESVVQLVRNLIRPEYGYLWQNGAKFATRYYKGAMDIEEWQAQCAESYHHLGEVKRHILVSGQAGMVRDPSEPIQNILNQQYPITALLGLIRAMEAKIPHSSWKARLATFKRDLLLIKMLTVNPLRIHNFSIMTYRKDNTGNLFQMPDGSWWLQYEPVDFKNQRGAASTLYKARLSTSVWKDIEEYLTTYRPMLAGATLTDLVFRPKRHSLAVPESTAMMTDKEFGMQLQKWTHQFIPNCPGFRAHAFRHIIATDFIKNHPQSFMIAASILHDKIETVMANYAHLKKSDDMEVFNRYLEGLYSRNSDLT